MLCLKFKQLSIKGLSVFSIEEMESYLFAFLPQTTGLCPEKKKAHSFVAHRAKVSLKL